MTTDQRNSTQTTRLRSLDVFRGGTIAAMLLVNNPGSWASIYPPLAHAAWHGCTPTDLIFPFFLFAVGSAMAISMRAFVDREKQPSAKLVWRIGRRAALLFLLGLLLSGFPGYDLAELRIPGVLQRIAVCYLIVSILILTLSTRSQAIVGAITLLAYWALETLVTIPPDQAPDLDVPGGDLSAWLDRTLLTPAHLWKGIYDPEGILSTFPAVVTTLSGYWVVRWLRARRIDARSCALLIGAGACCLLVGLAWGQLFPINKALWTSSYVVYTTGWALIVLAACLMLMDVPSAAPTQKRIGWPFEWMGRNAIAIFVGSGLLARILSITKIGETSLKGHITSTLSAAIESVANLANTQPDPRIASLAFALLTVTFWWAIAGLLWWRKWYIKV